MHPNLSTQFAISFWAIKIERGSRWTGEKKIENPKSRIQNRIIYLLILAIAFWLRWRFIQTVNLYPDEFVTLLAMDMIQQKGAPVLPSGLFYDHGLLYSYLAALAAFLGDAALWGRLTSLLFGLATIALTYHVGRRWFSPVAGLLAAAGLALAPAAVQWSGRVRMYALLQFLVLLTIYLMLKGAPNPNSKAAWGAIAAYFGALLTQFVAVALLPPMALGELFLKGEGGRIKKTASFFTPSAGLGQALRLLAAGAAVLIAFLLKRAGQPKGIAPPQGISPVTGIWQVLQIYGDLNLNFTESWRAISPFFFQPPALLFSLFAVIAVFNSFRFQVSGFRFKTPNRKPGTTLFLAIILVATTLEMLALVAPDRRDDKYLFMLLPVLLLLGARGMSLALEWVNGRMANLRMGEWANGEWRMGLMALAMVVFIGGYSRSDITKLLDDVGEDYRTAFAHVAQNWQPGDAVLTGTPAAAYYYLGRNDFYAVQAGGPYDYRILPGPDGQLVERWLASPWINTLEGLNGVLTKQPVWLVLERWGLLIQYYEPFFMQNILAQTEFIREDNGVIVLKSLPGARLLPESPAVPADALLHGVQGDAGQLKLLGYTLEDSRLTLYWQAQSPLAFDYTVFANVQNDAGETVTQVDHRPLGSVYPTTLWPPGEIIRETSQLQLPPGKYRLRVGMYRLESGERLWVPDDETMQNMVDLGEVEVE